VKLTPKQEKFCLVYLEAGNASEAYRQAYQAGRLSEAALAVEASRLLDHPKITLRLAELRLAAQQRNDITVDKIIRELALIGFSNMLDYVTPQADGTVFVDLSKLTRAQAAAIGEVTVEEYMEGRGEDARPVKRVKFKLSDKRAALVDLGKHLGMFPTQVSGKIDHNHKHDHEHRAVSDTADWVTGLLGQGSGRPPQKPLPN
jgi:phage terminase small subunit